MAQDFQHKYNPVRFVVCLQHDYYLITVKHILAAYHYEEVKHIFMTNQLITLYVSSDFSVNSRSYSLDAFTLIENESGSFPLALYKRDLYLNQKP